MREPRMFLESSFHVRIYLSFLLSTRVLSLLITPTSTLALMQMPMPPSCAHHDIPPTAKPATSSACEENDCVD